MHALCRDIFLLAVWFKMCNNQDKRLDFSLKQISDCSPFQLQLTASQSSVGTVDQGPHINENVPSGNTEKNSPHVKVWKWAAVITHFFFTI